MEHIENIFNRKLTALGHKPFFAVAFTAMH
jgi:hypothetical protein